MSKYPKLILVVLALSQLLALPALALDVAVVEREIHRLTNALRAEQGVAPLEPLDELDGLARRHSENMAEHHFFSHTDPEGLSPFDRMHQQIPELYSMGSGENIASRSSGEGELETAQALVTQWRNSSGHYKNIMNPEYLQLGVGVADNGTDVYATQNFAAGLVLLEAGPPATLALGSTASFRFRFLAAFPPEQLNIYGRFPSGSDWIKPVWSDNKHFLVQVPVKYGPGPYKLGIGKNGSFYSTPFGFEAVTE